MTETSSWPNERRELAKHVIDRLDEFPYPVLADMHREAERDQSVLTLSTYYDDELYGSEMVMRDEQLDESNERLWQDQFDRQLRAMGEVLDKNGVDRSMGEWGVPAVEKISDDYSPDVERAIILVDIRQPRVRDLTFDCTVVEESADGDRVRVSCTVGDQTIGETVRVDEDPVRVEDAMDALEQRALGILQR